MKNDWSLTLLAFTVGSIIILVTAVYLGGKSNQTPAIVMFKGNACVESHQCQLHVKDYGTGSLVTLVKDNGTIIEIQPSDVVFIKRDPKPIFWTDSKAMGSLLTGILVMVIGFLCKPAKP